MPEKHRELSKFADYLESWNRKTPLWIHLKGQPGVGKTYFINLLLTKKLTDYTTLFKVNSFFLLLPYHGQIQAIFGYLYRYHKKDVKLFSGKYPNFVRSNIIKIFNGTIKNIGDNIYSHHFSQNLLIKFIEFLSNRKNIVILFDGGLEFSVLQSMWLFDFFFKKCTFPALIITSVVSGNSEETQLDEEHTIKVDRMSVQEIHKFVELILHTNKINARLVTNHLQIKSQGNPRKIKYLIEGFYRQIIPQKTEELVDNRTLQNLRIHSANEFIFSKIIKHLSDPELSIFILLSNLDDPFPLKLLKDILKELEVNEADFFNRLSTYLEEREIFGQKFFIMPDNEFKQFIKANIGLEGIKGILELLKSTLNTYTSDYPLQLSHLYYEINDYPQSLKLAIREAEKFVSLHQFQRAYGRYSFVRRNLLNHPIEGIVINDLLSAIGELQKNMGLYDNAFESYRELRDNLTRQDQTAWFLTTLNMAEILLKMDALTEARFLLNDLKIIKMASLKTKATATMLFGDLEKNLGHENYALRYYEKAFSFLAEVNDKKLIYQIYRKRKDIYHKNESNEAIKSLIDQTLLLLGEETSERIKVELDLVKYFSYCFNYKLAYNLIIKIYKNLKKNIEPDLTIQTYLYLTDIYAFFGKWHLVKSHLNNLLQTNLFVINKKTKVRILINLAVVNKEISYYGESTRLLNEALKYCEQENFVYEINEIKILLGHIQLLVYGHVKTGEYLKGALSWAVENEVEDLIIMASLLMSHYELQKGRINIVKEHLTKARKKINQSKNKIDKLNYAYYLIQLLFKTEKNQWARKAIRFWETEGKEISKFKILSIWYVAKIEYKNGNYKQALTGLEEALLETRKKKLLQQEFQILKDLVNLSQTAGFHEKINFYHSELQKTFRSLLEAINDKILKKQFQESKVVEEILQWGINLERAS